MSVHVGYAAMSEQFHPTELVQLAVHAESQGFTGVMAADHFQPWVPAQGQAPYVWNVLTALGERTRGDVGPGVVCPSFKVHPALVAQASATLAAMYPRRHWLGLGAGEALNEHIVGTYWPEAPERLNRLWEAIEVIKKLFSGKEVKHRGDAFTLEKTRLWTLDERPPIYVATAGPLTARRAGREVDGIITPGASLDKIETLLVRFAEGARDAGKDPERMPKILRLHLSWAVTDAEAQANALTEWPNGGMKFPKHDVRSPYEFEQMGKLVRIEDFEGRMVISSDPDVHRAHIQQFLDVGVDRVYLHNVGRNQREWMDVFSREVLPKLTR
jgi:coenzyme F420-dependent glucose-6-phosphate dehydrogenase